MSIHIKACPARGERLKAFIDREFSDYSAQNGVELNYEGFCFAAEDEAQNVLGVITGRALYNEVHIQDLVVRQGCRKTGLGSMLIGKVEETFRGKGYDVMTVTTYGFQAPAFYPRFGFRLEFVREAADPRLSKYFFSKRI